MRVVLLGALTVALSIAQAAPTATGAPRAQFGIESVYLPALLVSGGVVKGRITTTQGAVTGDSVVLFCGQTGVPATASARVELQADGEFVFNYAPVLSPGQYCFAYYFRYTLDPSRLAWLDTGNITTIARDQLVDLGDLDVTGMELLSPASGATVGMPTEFIWSRRPTATDSYILRVSDPRGYVSTVYTDELGYVDRATISAFEAGTPYQPNVEYLWGVSVHMPNGTVGGTMGRSIRFSHIVTADLVQDLDARRTLGSGLAVLLPQQTRDR